MRIVRVLLIGLLLGGLLVGGFWYFRVRSRLKAISGEYDTPKPTRAVTLEVQDYPGADFDQSIQLPGNPIGIAVHGDEMILCNRENPWGFLRLLRTGPGEFEARKLAVIEKEYGQTMGFNAVSWNGKEYVAITQASWFQRGDGDVFTVHDPVTLAVRDFFPAPKLSGCIAWDGSQYWVATRRNTADSGEPAFLYRVDTAFRVTAKYDPPAVGCQGLAWDGSKLWWGDVFSDSIYVIDVSSDPPQTVHTYNSHLNYLSGIGFDGKNIWVSEYDQNQLHRLRSALRAEWTGTPVPVEPAPAGMVEWEEPKASDSYTNDSPDTGDEAMEVIELSVEGNGSSILASWRIHCGNALFEKNTAADSTITMPTFVRYTITVEGGSLNAPKEKVYEAEPGENRRSGEEIASDLAPGRYSVSLFLHAQYVDAEGTNRILNSSSPSLSIHIQ